jgi:FixJ family two-component response regulator
LRVKVFGSASEFLKSGLPNAPSCLVLDIRLPGIGGLEFQIDLEKAGIRVPIIFMTGHGDIPMSVQAMKAGAVDFLTKPLRHQELIHAVTRALAVDRKRRTVPIIFVTAFPEEPARARALREGAICFLSKASHASILLKCVEAALALRLKTGP